MKFPRIGLSILLALISIAAWAEPPSDDQWAEHMKGKLSLNEKQMAEVKKIQEALKPEREALREQHKALHAKMSERLKTVLTEEQQKKFEEMHQQRGMGGMHGGMMGGMNGDKAAMESCPTHCQGKGMEDCAKHCADKKMKECPSHGEGAGMGMCAEHCGAGMAHCPKAGATDAKSGAAVKPAAPAAK